MLPSHIALPPPPTPVALELVDTRLVVHPYLGIVTPWTVVCSIEDDLTTLPAIAGSGVLPLHRQASVRPAAPSAAAALPSNQQRQQGQQADPPPTALAAHMSLSEAAPPPLDAAAATSTATITSSVESGGSPCSVVARAIARAMRAGGQDNDSSSEPDSAAPATAATEEPTASARRGGGGGGLRAGVLLDHDKATLVGCVRGRLLLPPAWLASKLQFFMCMRGATNAHPVTTTNMNAHITEPLNDIAEEYELGYEANDNFRAKSTKRAVELLKRLAWRIDSPAQLRLLKGVKGIGDSTIEKIEQLLTRGSIDKLRGFKNDAIRVAAKEFKTIWGIGPAKSRELAAAGLRSVREVIDRELHGKGPRLTYRGKALLDEDARACLAHYDDMQVRIPRAEVEELIAAVRAGAEKVYGTRELLITCCGSFRRGKATSGDVDILIAPQTQRGLVYPIAPLIAELTSSGFLIQHLRAGGTHWGKANAVGLFDPSRDSARWTQFPGYAYGATMAHNNNAGSTSSSAAAATASPAAIITGVPRDDASGGHGVVGAKRDRPADWSSSSSSSSAGAAAASAAAKSAGPRPLLPLPPDAVLWDDAEKLPTKDYKSESYMGVCRLPPAVATVRAATAGAAASSTSTTAPETRRARRIDIKSYPRDIFAFALCYFTGSDYFNRSLRNYAKKCGWSLSDQGLKAAVRSKGKKEDRIAESVSIRCDTEEDIFKACGVPYRSPSERNSEVDIPTNNSGSSSGAAVAVGGSPGRTKQGLQPPEFGRAAAEIEAICEDLMSDDD